LLTDVDFDPFAGAELARAVPSTEAQREVWLADQMGREASLAFNESVSLRFEGPIDTAALQSALNGLVDRHESLRLTLSSDGLSLLIAASGQWPLRLVDLEGETSARQEEALADLRREAVETPFDLLNGPLVRAQLARCSPTHSELILTAHHIICDGWSFGVLCRELMSLYRDTASQPGSTLAQADSFGDYALTLAGEERQAAIRMDTQWWKEKHRVPADPLDLPTDRPRPSVRRFESLREEVEWPPEETEALRKLGAGVGASLFASMFSAFAALLSRLSGQTDLVIGVPAAAQSAEGKASLVGHCVQFLPIRIEVDPRESFQDFLKRARSVVLDAFDHQTCTLGGLLKEVTLPRDPSRVPLTSVMFNLDAALGGEELSLPGLKVDFHSNPRHFENFELFLNAAQIVSGPKGAKLRLECQYNTGLFDGVTVRRWLTMLRETLARAVSQPATPVSDLVLAPQADLDSLARFQGPVIPSTGVGSVSALIAAGTALQPGAVAVVFGNREWTHGELSARVNTFARYLRSRGLGRGKLVGLCLERGPEMLMAQLAILQSGAAYVPLDPGFPPDRLAYMAQDAKLSLLVTSSHLEGMLDWPRAESVFLDLDAEAIESVVPPSTPADPTLDAGAGDPAYVIYTSGSTGKPKGVVVHHQAVVNFLDSMKTEPGLNAGDTLVAVTTLSFDIAVLELLLPLCVGGRVVLASRDEALDGARLRDLIESHGASVVQATPATWRLLIDTGWKGHSNFKALVGGEPLPLDLSRQLLERCGQLWNMYGPTETTIWSTLWRVAPDERGISIGRPIANTTVWVVDEARRPCPIGVPGEMLIGGDGVALGYWNRPELTAEKFLDDPFSPGGRIYRTGDRGRWRNDGLLEHLGRLDFQVKVRGFRIELGEIETNLATHPLIGRAVVLVREDRPGDTRLVAYLVAREPGSTVTDGVLRAHLKSSLPDYMVPHHFLFLDALPLLPNGKLDRKSLPAPDSTLVKQEESTAPRNETERAVAEEMEAVLGVRGIGVFHDFFSLGGHSLLAAQLTYRLNKRFGVSLSMRQIFQTPTIAGLAEWLARNSQKPGENRMTIPHLADRSRVGASLMQERLWFLEKMVPGRVVYHAPSAHRLKGPLNEEAFQRAFKEIIRRQASLRTRFEGQGTIVEQVITPDVSLELFPAEDLSGLPAEERGVALTRRLEELTARTFDLGGAPLFAARMFRLTPREHVLFFMPHHIIWDGWSFDIFYTEMSALYGAFCLGKPSPLPELPVTYADFAVWHREWTQSADYLKQVDYWRQKMARHGLPSALPSDKPRRAGMSGEGNTEGVGVDRTTTRALHDLASQSGATLFVTTLAIYTVVLYDYARNENLVIGTPVRGRNQPELESIMGFFNNLVLLHIPIQTGERFVDFLTRLKSIVIECFSYPDAPLEELSRDLPTLSKDGPPLLYQALFSFQDARQRITQWGELSHSMIPLFHRGATEDLGMWFLESSNGLQGGVTYNTEILESTTAQKLRDRYLDLMKAVLNDSGKTILDLVGPQSTFSHGFGDGASAPSSESTGKPPFVEPRNDLEISLANVWQRILGIEKVGIHDNFFDLGGNSLGVINLSVEMEKASGMPIDVGEVFRSPTIAQLVVSMGPRAEKCASVVVPLQSRGQGTPLFCICGINIYLDFAARLGDAQPVYGVYVAEEQAIANQAIKGEMPDVSIGRLVEAYYHAILRFRPQGPYRLAGFSLGGILALELAAMMRHKGDEVEIVLLQDTFLPQAYRRNWGRWTLYKLKETAQKVGNLVGSLWPFRDKNGKPSGATEPKPDSGYALLRALAFEAAARHWKPDEALTHIPIILFQASDLDKEYPYLDFETDYGWGKFFGPHFHSLKVPGDHLGILAKPNVDVLAAKTRPWLADPLGGKSVVRPV